jgi:hypothetical protein
MTQYLTADSRLASFFILNGYELQGTEVRSFKEDDRVLLRFNIDEADLARLKREFFESEKGPFLEYANAMKFCMHCVREARELTRESLQ